MSNEVLILFSALTDILFVFIAAQFGSRWLFGTIAANLILVSVFGLKLITVFGLVTNVGNVFYACIFLATHFSMQRKDIRGNWWTIWFGAFVAFFFLIMSRFAVHYSGLYPDDVINSAIQTLFSLSPRVATASIVAYVFAQHINVSLYWWIKKQTGDKYLWLQSNGANIVAQLADSSLFFTVAFLDLSGFILLQAIFAGWIIKVCVVLLGTPLLYLDRYLQKKK